jgi:glutaredoxin
MDSLPSLLMSLKNKRLREKTKPLANQKRVAPMGIGFVSSVLTLLRKRQDPRTPPEQGIRVQLFGKKDCHLCAVAKDVIQRVRSDIPFVFKEVDVEADQGVYEMFKNRIPVIFIDGKEAFVYKVTERSLKQALENPSVLGARQKV